jgi:DNA repair exonuclease SbcCD ATPase subunit
MISFHKVTSQNFFSVGDNPIEIVLDEAPSTLVIGKNGAAKSSALLDAICFGLFGKPYRNINKPQIINSVNGKNCLVKIEFSIGVKKYLVVRGLKPNIFEIYLDGDLLNQDSHTRDYQKVLEQTILKFNFKTFTQVVILGAASHTPFMQLPTGQRREVIEDLLDINIFTLMNTLLKEHNSLRSVISSTSSRKRRNFSSPTSSLSSRSVSKMKQILKSR